MQARKFSLLSKKNLQRVKGVFLDTIFPHFCLGCKIEGTPLCLKCLEKITLLKNQVCPLCEKNITPTGEVCLSCQQKDPRGKFLTRVLVAASYEENLLAHAIHLFKYRFVKDLSPTLALLLQKILQRFPFPEGNPDFLIPVPLHHRRLRYRGFNQSEVLARNLLEILLKDSSDSFTKPTSWKLSPDLLIRQRYTPPQVKLESRHQRLENLKEAFAVNPKFIRKGKVRINSTSQNFPIQNKHLLLLDDISTTGATILECVQALAPFRPHSISALVLARQKSH